VPAFTRFSISNSANLVGTTHHRRRLDSMSLLKIYAHLSCSSLSVSIPWFERLFGRKPDATPMDGLAEWHHGEEAGFQLFHQSGHAGKGTLTLIVSGLAKERERLAALKPGEIEPADYVHIVRLRDPDDNLVVLAESKA
jgi:hypothetical protein